MSTIKTTKLVKANGKTLNDLKAFDARFENCEFAQWTDDCPIEGNVMIANIENANDFCFEIDGEDCLYFFGFRGPRPTQEQLNESMEQEIAFGKSKEGQELVRIAFDFFTKTEEIALIPVSKAQQARDMAILNPQMSKYAIAKELGMYYSAVVAALK